MTRKDEQTREQDRERARNSTLLRAEYVLPIRRRGMETTPVEVVDQPAQLGSPTATDQDGEGAHDMHPFNSAETDVKIARAQLVNRVRALARVGNRNGRSVLRQLTGIVGGVGVAVVIGVVALPVLLMGRRRDRLETWFGGTSGRLGVAAALSPLRRELMQVAGVTLAHWARTLWQAFWMRPIVSPPRE